MICRLHFMQNNKEICTWKEQVWTALWCLQLPDNGLLAVYSPQTEPCELKTSFKSCFIHSIHKKITRCQQNYMCLNTRARLHVLQIDTSCRNHCFLSTAWLLSQLWQHVGAVFLAGPKLIWIVCWLTDGKETTGRIFLTL